MKRPNKIRFNVTLNQTAYRALKSLSKSDRRSNSNMLEVLIRQEADKNQLKRAA